MASGEHANEVLAEWGGGDECHSLLAQTHPNPIGHLIATNNFYSTLVLARSRFVGDIFPGFDVLPRQWLDSTKPFHWRVFFLLCYCISVFLQSTNRQQQNNKGTMTSFKQRDMTDITDTLKEWAHKIQDPERLNQMVEYLQNVGATVSAVRSRRQEAKQDMRQALLNLHITRGGPQNSCCINHGHGFGSKYLG